jgi:aryl-alcohol dehydrogenase-like predicted oxidoreductase
VRRPQLEAEATTAATAAKPRPQQPRSPEAVTAAKPEAATAESNRDRLLAYGQGWLHNGDRLRPPASRRPFASAGIPASVRVRQNGGRPRPVEVTVALPTRPMGTRGTPLSTIGLGAWAMGGLGWEHAWGTQDDEVSIATIQRAAEVGVNWIDTAPVYGHGHSEEVVGRALAGLPEDERPLVFTKCGVIWDPADHMAPPTLDLRGLRGEVEASLRRLGTDHIDVLQVHAPPKLGPDLPRYWGELVAMRAAGTVGALGLSNHTVAQLDVAERIGHVDVLQPPLSLLRRQAAADLVPWCARHGTAVVGYSPLESGLLTGAYTAERVAALPADDWRRTAGQFQGEALDRTLRLIEALRPVAARHEVPVSAIAIAWVLAWPGVTGAIVGARRPDQVQGWPAAAGVVLTENDLDEVAAALTTTGAGDGPVRP